MEAYSAQYRIPFCSTFAAQNFSKFQEGSVDEDIILRYASTATLWETLPSECQVSTIIITSVGIVVLLLSLLSNTLMLVSSFKVKPKSPASRGNEEAAQHYAALKNTLTIGSLFRGSSAISALITCVLLLPFVGISGYELLFSSVDRNKKLQNDGQLTWYKNVACVLFHVVISSTTYNVLGAILERWSSNFGLDPEEYLDRRAKPTSAASFPSHKKPSTEKKSHGSGKSHRKKFICIYIFISWAISIAFGVVSVVYGKVRLLLYGEYFGDESLVFTSHFGGYIDIPKDTMLIMTIIYIVFLYVPLLLLIFALAITLCYLLSIQSKAESLENYDEACFRSECGKEDVLAPSQETADSLTKNDSSENKVEVAAEYSHKNEHARQVAENCQETELNGIVTDCIQLENDDTTEPNPDSSTPPPPEWMKYPSIAVSRYSTISTVQVLDLAKTVPVDSARAYFGETIETRATLIYCATTALFLLPLCALLSFDIFSATNSILQNKYKAYFGTLISYHTVSNLSIIFLALLVFGGIFPCALLYSASPPFKRGTRHWFRKHSTPQKTKQEEQSQKLQQITLLPKIEEETVIYATDAKTAF